VSERVQIALEKSNRALRLLGAINQALICTTDAESLLNAACRISVEVGGYPLAWVGYVDDDNEIDSNLAAHAGFDSEKILSEDLSWIFNTSLRLTLSNVVRTGQPSILDSLQTDPNFTYRCETVIQDEYQSLIVLPLVSEKRVFAVMVVYSKETDAFDSNEVEILRQLTGNLSFGIRALQTRASLSRTEKSLQVSEDKSITETDSAEYAQAEVTKRKSETFLESIVENIPNMIFIKDAKELRFVLFNRAGEELLGYKRDELLGKNDYDFFSKEQADFFTRKDREVLASGLLYDIPEEPIDTKTGTRFLHTKKIPIFDDFGDPEFLLGISEDITERKRSEEKLRRSEMGLATAQRMTHLGSWELDIVQNQLSWSDEIYRIFEIDPKLFGASYEAFLEAIHPEDRESVNTAYTESLKTRKPYNIMHRLLMKDGRIKYVNERSETYYDEDGRALRSIGTVQDITERKINEDELRRYKDHLEDKVQQRTVELVAARDAAEAANKAKSVFLANMSHELRTPLNAILGFSSLMSRDEELSDSQRENITIIIRSGEHLLNLINDVLEMAKIEAGRAQIEIIPFDLGSMVCDVIELMQLRCHEKGLTLELDQSSEFPRYIKGDQARLRQILLNLLSNAYKFTEKGGVILRLGVKGNHPQQVLIEVQDSGPGITAEDQKQLFKPFVQLMDGTTSQGTGLGLTITRQFVQMMGGTISLESEYGNGALFRVELPLQQVSEEEVLTHQAKIGGEVIGLAPGQPAFRILIAEDQRDSQLLINRLMTNIGFETKLVENGEECVKRFMQWHPHLIWMDWRMPVMDGVEACRKIRKAPGGESVKIIAVTASAFKEEREEALSAGMDDLVRKPYHFDELYNCMAKHLGLKYLYAKSDVNEVPSTQVTSVQLKAVSSRQRSLLLNALKTLDSERVAAAIRDIAMSDAEVASSLDQLASDFNYPAMIEALESVAED
jgi:PAS domain S-box-containing protein